MGPQVWDAFRLCDQPRRGPPGPVDSGHEPDDATALLLGEAAPHAVALAVLQGPRQTGLPDVAGRAERQRRSRLLLGGGEERVRVDPVAGRLVLPDVRGGGVGGERFQVDASEAILGHTQLRAAPSVWAGAPEGARARRNGSTVRIRTRTVLKSQGPRSIGRLAMGVPRR